MASASSSSDEGDGGFFPDASSVRDHTPSDTVLRNLAAKEEVSHDSPQSTGQKRRRVTRACDECRRKKIKCDGKQPCTHCTVYSYDCTYDQPSHRRRNPAPQYIEALESRLARAEAVIRTYLPNLDWQDPGLDQMLQQHGPLSSNSRSQLNRSSNDKGMSRVTSNDPTLESMVEATGQLDMDERGNWDYHGGSSGLLFMRGMRNKLGDLEEPENSEDSEERSRSPRKPRKTQIRVPSPPPFVGERPNTVDSPYESPYIGADELPGRELARRLCVSALDDATAILKLVHQPSFYYRFDRIYDLPQEKYNNEDHAFLPLLYVVIALGCLFTTDPQSDLGLKGYKSATGVGYKYFWASRQLMDVTDCRDLTSLQAIVFMIMFLQCSAKLATCYAFIGVALRSALRMGLHRSFKENFNPVEAEIRKRLFWTIKKMDVYVGAMLGLPLTLSDDDVDQEYPIEVDDDHITVDGIVAMPEGTLSALAATNANFRLSKILCKIVRSVYPIKSCQSADGGPSKAYSISYATIREIERDLQRWQESLPLQLQPGEDGAPGNIRQQQLLRMGYAHAQMMLYRPFLHYVSSRNQRKPVNQRAYACAAACISVSRNIIHITAEMKRHGLLEGSYWFTMYTTFFGVLSLTFFVLENPDSPTSQEVLKDAKEGKETLAKLAQRSMAADRCSSTLSVLFDQVGGLFEEQNTSTENVGQKVEASTTLDAPIQIKTSKPDLTKDTAKGARKGSGSSASAGGPRANAAPRQRGMRLISQTGRPQPQRQQQQNQPRTSPTQQSTPQQPWQPPQQQQLPHQAPQVSGIPAAGFYMPNVTMDSPTTTSSSSTFNTPHDQQNQSFYGPQQQYPFLPTQFQDLSYPDNISNLSTMMFPSDNPFHYPNQPMTTLEQNFELNSNNTNDMYSPSQQSPPHTTQQDMFLPPNTSAPGPGSMAADDHMDAQPFGGLPPYLSHHPDPTSGNMGFFDAASSLGLGPELGMPTSGPDMWTPQARSHGLPAMNLGEIFAGDGWQDAELRFKKEPDQG